jgi:peptide/nickel transport system ATP-binding protein
MDEASTTRTSAPAQVDAGDEPLLELQGLKVTFELDEGTVRAVEDVSFSVRSRQVVGVIGESGCGKSVTAQAIMRIVPPPGAITGGKILFRSRQNDDRPLDVASLRAQSRTARQIRGGEICMIFQEPMTAFSPVHTIGNQITEAIRLHRGASRAEARRIAADMLERVGIPQGRSRLDAYSFQLSGGLRQRAMIAMALCTRPRLVIADEPTTALDVTIQAQILELLLELRDEFSMAVLLITHDLGVVAETCEVVHVMYMGRIVESASVDQIFHNPLHPYTRALLGSIPRLSGPTNSKLTVIRGSVPDPYATIKGCAFADRCDDVIAGTCDRGGPPPLVEIEPGHSVACHLHTGAPR